MLWFTFFLNWFKFYFPLFKTHYHTLTPYPKQRKIKFKLRKKLNHNIYNIMVQFVSVPLFIGMHGNE